MSELLLVNPRRKRRVSRIRRNPRRRMSALQRQYFGGGGGRRRRRVTRLRRNPVAVAGSPMPSRRRRFSRARAYVSRMRRRRSGGGGFGIGSVTDMLIPAFIGAGGAMALDMAWGALPIPDALKSGPLAPVTRIGGALAIGVLVGMVAGRRYGAIAGAGALTVTVYDIVKPMVAANFPSIPGLSYYNPARMMGAYMGAYV